MAKHAITPWRHRRDLLLVRQQIYGDTERRHAVHRVMAWKLRGNLPHAVESTALLVDAILHHGIEGVSIFSIRAVYSAAFSRFVTGFCDIGRNKERSLEPSSMVDIAKQIGMPPAFVALRHEATHEELPAIQRLVKATKEALDWLWNVYWSRLEEPESEEALASSIPKLRAQAKDFFRTWRSARREAVRSKKPRQQVEDVQAAANSCVALIQEKGASSVGPRTQAIAGLLIEDGLLFPSKREIGSSLNGAFLIWDALLHEIEGQHHMFLDALVQSSLSNIDPENSRAKANADLEGICLWLLHMLSSDAASLQQVVLRREVIRWCCTHPGEWPYFVGKRLVDSDAELGEDWKDVLESSQVQQSAEGDLISDVVMTADSSSPLTKSWTWAVAASRVPIGVVR